MRRPETRVTGKRVPLVEVLSFDGCPNQATALAAVRNVAGELGLDPEIRLVDVPDLETAHAYRFLGSPTVRVDGRDIEPGASERTDYVLSCRLYETDGGISGQPDERWIRQALSQQT